MTAHLNVFNDVSRNILLGDHFRLAVSRSLLLTNLH